MTRRPTIEPPFVKRRAPSITERLLIAILCATNLLCALGALVNGIGAAPPTFEPIVVVIDAPPATPPSLVAAPTVAISASNSAAANAPLTATRSAQSPPVTPTLRPAPPTPRLVTNPSTKAVSVDGHVMDVYRPAATKARQQYHYSCEFDAAWVVLKTYGIDVDVDAQMKIVGVDTRVEPAVKNTPEGVFIYGGDITRYWSGSFDNYMARMSGQAMRKVFEYYSLKVTPVNSRAGIEAALRAGQLVWIKTTADFKPGRPATWVMPDGRTYQTVLGNDHAATVIGFNAEGVAIRDVLGPTNTNWNRRYEYFVDWRTFLTIWAQQSNDGLAVAPPSSP